MATKNLKIPRTSPSTTDRLRDLKRELAETKKALIREEKRNERLSGEIAKTHERALKVLICLTMAVKEL